VASLYERACGCFRWAMKVKASPLPVVAIDGVGAVILLVGDAEDAAAAAVAAAAKNSHR